MPIVMAMTLFAMNTSPGRGKRRKDALLASNELLPCRSVSENAIHVNTPVQSTSTKLDEGSDRPSPMMNREYPYVNDQARQWMDDVPEGAELGASLLEPKLGPRGLPDIAAVLEQVKNHLVHSEPKAEVSVGAVRFVP